MIKSVIDKIDQLHPITNKPLSYVVKKEINDIFYPCELKNNEYKQLIDFQKLSDFHYWYLTNEVSSKEIDNLYSIKKVYELTYPMRIFICRKDGCDENMVLKFYQEIENLSMATRASLGILNCKIQIKSFALLRDIILQEEFNQIPKLMDKYAVASIDVDIVIQIDKDCLDELC